MRTIQKAAATLVLAVAASGCSVYDEWTTSDFAKQDGDAIVEAASEAMQDVTSVRMTGQVRDKGEQYFLDVSVDRDGRCAGTLRIGGSNFDVRRIGKRGWVKGESGGFNRLTGSTVPTRLLDELSRKWIEVKGKEAVRLCDFGKLLKAFKVVPFDGPADAIDAPVPAAVGDESRIDGQKAVELSGSPGGNHDELSWVLSEAPHYVVKVESTSTQDGGSLAFTEFNEPVEVEAPKRKDVLKP